MNKSKHKGLLITVIALVFIAVIAVEANMHAFLPYDLSAMSRSISRSVKASVSGTDGEHMVYVTNSGEKYHSPFCRYLRYSSREMTIQEAESRGYEPCSRCTP
ncbi:MAG: hypothetical protein IJI20_07745 [Firmicutes bacterium]|nr:hypothetical protein [Bacillota bacterium]